MLTIVYSRNKSFLKNLKKVKYHVNDLLTMSNQRIRIIGKKRFNEETKVVGIRVPISKYDDIKNLVNLLVNNILRGRQIRIQAQRKNGIIKDVLNEIKDSNEEEIQSQEIIDLKNGFRELLTIKNKVSQNFDNSFWSLLSDEKWNKILKQGDFELIEKVVKNLNNPDNPNDSNLKGKIEKLAKKGNPYTEKELKFFKEEIYKNMLSTFDLLNDLDELETFLSYLTEEEKNKLYSHKLLDHYDLLP